MQRDLDALADRQFDLLVIGGGIYGACIARDAALRGLSVALIERADFSSGTSHNSLKIIHGGLRYLQHLDFRRVRESIGERRTWQSIAPHLVRPLQVAIPTQGYLSRGPAALQSAIVLHRLLGLNWNRGVPNDARIGIGRVRGKESLRSSIPGLPMAGLTGIASWYDGQAVDADRVVLECLQSAVDNGAVIANYLAADAILNLDGRAFGVSARDQVGHREIEIKARITVNATGPWSRKILQRSLGDGAASLAPPLAKNMNVVTRRQLLDHCVGVPSKRSADAVVGSQSRLYFITPWKGVSVIGTAHFAYDGDPDGFGVTDREIGEFVDEINESFPPAKLTLEDIVYVYSGLTPAETESVKGEVGRSKHADIIDHGARSGCEGLISAIGVKYTTSRLIAERVVSLVQKKLGVAGGSRKSRSVRLPGAEGWTSARTGELQAAPGGSELDDLLSPYGTRRPDGLGNDRIGFSEAFAACVGHSVDREMALHLDDFLLRRNDLAARGCLTLPLVRLAAEAMSRKLHWSATETNRQEERICRSIRYLPGVAVPASGSGLSGRAKQ